MKAPVGLVEQSRNPEPFGAVLALKKFRVLCNVFSAELFCSSPFYTALRFMVPARKAVYLRAIISV